MSLPHTRVVVWGDPGNGLEVLRQKLSDLGLEVHPVASSEDARAAIHSETVDLVVSWLDGSFVEDKPDPRDFDVVSFVDHKQFLGLSEPCQQRIEGLLGGRQATKPAYHAHTIMVQACAPDHPYYRVYRKARDYWKDEAFGQVWLFDATTGRRTPSGVPKGFLEITTGPAAPVVLPETEVTR